MVKKRKRKARPGLARDAIYEYLRKIGGSPARGKLAQLWQAWPQIMGDSIADIARPLGSRGRLLLVGADNALAIQELGFYCEEMVERANSFLGCEYFERARVNLAACDVKPVDIFEETEERPQPAMVRQASASGKYLRQMDMASPVARCYALFAAKPGKKRGKT